MLYFQCVGHFLFLLIGQNENKQSNHKKMIKYSIFWLITH